MSDDKKIAELGQAAVHSLAGNSGRQSRQVDARTLIQPAPGRLASGPYMLQDGPRSRRCDCVR